MSEFFGEDLRDVRIHSCAAIAPLGVCAVTVGDRVYVDQAEVASKGGFGLDVLGHELAHVVQQRRGQVRAGGRGPRFVLDPALEEAANRSSREFLRWAFERGSEGLRGVPFPRGERGRPDVIDERGGGCLASLFGCERELVIQPFWLKNASGKVVWIDDNTFDAAKYNKTSATHSWWWMYKSSVYTLKVNKLKSVSQVHKAVAPTPTPVDRTDHKYDDDDDDGNISLKAMALSTFGQSSGGMKKRVVVKPTVSSSSSPSPSPRYITMVTPPTWADFDAEADYLIQQIKQMKAYGNQRVDTFKIKSGDAERLAMALRTKYEGKWADWTGNPSKDGYDVRYHIVTDQKQRSKIDITGHFWRKGIDKSQGTGQNSFNYHVYYC